MARTTVDGAKSPAPKPDPQATAVEFLMTSVFTGVSLMVSTVTLAALGGSGLFFGRNLAGVTGAKIGFAVGLGLGVLLLGLLLRVDGDRLRNRSDNLYRGLWIGMLGAGLILGLMAFAPQVAFPVYCPPGAIC